MGSYDPPALLEAMRVYKIHDWTTEFAKFEGNDPSSDSETTASGTYQRFILRQAG